MTVSTMLWATSGIGDGSASGYPDAQTQRLFRQLFQNDPTVHGVIAGADNELAPSVTGTAEIAVATGSALIYGVHLYSNAITTLTLTTPAADTGGIVYAGITWSTQVGAISNTQAASGTTTIPTLTQTALTAWQIPICSYVIDSAGAVWTNAAKTTAGVTDLRRFIGMADLRIEYRQGGSATVWSTEGATDYRVNGSDVKFYRGVRQTGVGGTRTITFPVAFTYAPSVHAWGQGGLPVAVGSVTTSSFEVTTYDVDFTTPLGSTTVHWEAIGI